MFPAARAGPYQVFDRRAKQVQKDRAAAIADGSRSRIVDYVRDEVADRLMERFMDIKRTFTSIVDLGSGAGHFSKLLIPAKVKKSVMIDVSERLLHRDPDDMFNVEIERIHGDEEHLLEIIPPESQEAVVSCLSMHWVNDLPGTLIQIRRALKPDGLFLGAMFGGDTLFELRTSLQLAELEREGGLSPHVSPMTGTQDVSNLLGRAGFTMLTVDIDEVRIGYPCMWELMRDLQDMGESNTILGRRSVLHRDTLLAASSIYKELHGTKDTEGIPATFQIIYMIGWKPSPTQPKPLAPGSGQVSLKEVL
ncbi:S-adenosyl-L-methionine-dependent methyltransferase [Fistulina hepatica ATCC 64428]|uniref:S-adenosyl-L-methionine-dependent methyltransferase n=1 Tax=Fistulina hepatica ATCC 64428 TaxID=1128425 RepID=A0A0D7AKL1_9AGAR|nr:S-adenosyl-L-methionine-dependent methyltransferase [Fistulina hepatica ATCC 64428]